MFYLEDYLTVKKGEEIFGSIAVRPNEKNVVRYTFWEYDLLCVKVLFAPVLSYKVNISVILVSSFIA